MPRLSAALIVDTDPKGLEALAYGFTRDGCRVTSCADVTSATDLMQSASPEVLVVAIREPVADAFSLIAHLRQEPATARLPIVALGPPTVRDAVRSQRADLLPLPAFVRDVLTACKLLVALEPEQPEPIDEGVVRGALSDYGLFFVVRTMMGLGRSGIVQVERASRRGEIRICEGELASAQVGTLQGSAALHHLLLWEQAVLEVRFRPVVRRSVPNRTPEETLEEAERFLRDFAAATKELGPTATIFNVDADKVAAVGDAVPAEVLPVLRLFDGQRPLGEVIEDSPFRVFDTLRVATRLVDLGVLVRGAVPADPAAANGAAPVAVSLEPAPALVVPASANGTTASKGVARRAPQAVGTPPAAQAKDLRTGPANRRKGHRRDRPAPDSSKVAGRPAAAAQPARAAAHPASAPAPSPATPVDAGPAADAKAPAREGRTTGSIEVRRGELRATPRHVPVMDATPSVVVAFDDQAGAPSPATEARPAAPGVVSPSVAAAMAEAAALSGPATPPPVVVAEAPPAPQSPGPAAPAPKARISRTGEIAAVTAPVAPVAAAPAPGPAIQLDPGLMAEMDAIEMSRLPATPPPEVLAPAPAPTPPPKPQPIAQFVRGEIAAPRPTPVPVAPMAVPAVVVDLPPLDPEVPPATALPAPLGSPADALPRSTAVPAPEAPAPSAADVVHAPVAPVPPSPRDAGPGAPPPSPPATASNAPADPAQARGRAGKRQSGDFDPLEADFFAREADLYKQEVDSFDDLDPNHRRR